MDYRRRKYYAIRLYYYKGELQILKENIPSLKVLEPYNHFKCKDTTHKFRDFVHDHDCNTIGNYINVVVSCLIEESEKFEEIFEQIPNMITGYNKTVSQFYRFILELNKDNLGQ